MTTTVSLVLGSGGARGYAHIGVIEELVARGYEIAAVAGCSMGALVGGLYAAGRLADYRDWVHELNYLDVIRLLDLSFRTPGVINGSRVFDVIADMVGDTRIEDLDIPFTAVATDLESRKEIWFQDGQLLRAIRASIAIPSLFTPVNYNGRTLVDGGVLNPLPIAPTVSSHSDLIIAVDLNADVNPLVLQCETPVQEADRQQKILDRWLSKLSWRTRKYSESDNCEQAEATVKTGMLDIFNQSLEVMQESLARYKMAGYSPDILVPISRNQCRFYEFNRAEDMVRVGRLETERILDNFEAARNG
ncbi:patatin-like phospholipase family protein [Sansalvadorimonas sp. 2012CJ34-2]|uniref:Patatin-like phospholipase family protein n=1 Tax=Parendozoicomonas callyspongiae TaxID=2942213 RepID=A0ABT0PBA2_9GAMM|nr:patatin-like phospholipase family protein [Sansalvadorimonas sp. 2012CJ34-2]MCL6268665.1 patatin-like phospholipase family protein [Sansalvadorimonas sp. 2012CJ34-2]